MLLNVQYVPMLERGKTVRLHVQTSQSQLNRTYGATFDCFAKEPYALPLVRHYLKGNHWYDSLSPNSSADDYVPAKFDTETESIVIRGRSYPVKLREFDTDLAAELEEYAKEA